MDRYTQPDWAQAALITVDMQRDFTLAGAPAEVAGTAEVAPAIARLLALFRKQSRPVVHVVRFYQEGIADPDNCRKALVASGASIVRPGTPGAALADPLMGEDMAPLDPAVLLSGDLQALGSKEWAMYKPRWGAFFGTSLDNFLRSRGLNTLIFTGCNFPNCPRTSMYEASERDFRIVLVRDAMSGVYDRGLQEMEGIGTFLCSTEELITLLTAE
jgi:nicotinamidase-related amidase